MNTQTWICDFVTACQKKTGKDPYFSQCDTVGSPLTKWFPDLSPAELHYHLLVHGLFEPYEWINMENTVHEMDKNNIWKMVNREYNRLKNKWKGPEIPIFIFPVRQAHLAADKRAVKKNGLAFKKAIFLFLAPDLAKEEIKAALAHEYNHVCRLTHLNVDDHQLSLKEALIIEGLGEFAVKELYGEKWLAPWTGLYSFADIADIWNHRFVPALHLAGKDSCDDFLYGREDRQLPKWIGYHIGFQIVDTYETRLGPFPNNELYTKSSDELIAGSIFAYENRSETRENQEGHQFD
ncbi:DUF2268 domain-containing protein [Domibacillus antri]|nr:DUF2268 domain-containing putative Zn-dependent protease [Domibacillus antri]